MDWGGAALVPLPLRHVLQDTEGFSREDPSIVLSSVSIPNASLFATAFFFYSYKLIRT